MKELFSTRGRKRKENVFHLFQEILLDKIKVVILEQDLYHLPEVADGLANKVNATGAKIKKA
ncbi:8427_t:CDS:2, partial [Gigaspora margarita]